jgi:hypothetical protein
MAGQAHLCHQRRVNAFIGEPAQFSTENKVFVSEIIGREKLRRFDVVGRESRVVGDDRFNCESGAQLAQDQFDRHTSAPDYGLSTHNIGVNFDPFVCHGAPHPRPAKHYNAQTAD